VSLRCKTLGTDPRSHPHELEDFLTDLHNSGVFTFTPDDVTWSHPVIKQYYWVKSLISKGKEQPIIKNFEAVTTQLSPHSLDLKLKMPAKLPRR
jgi:hypothetical protein